MLNLVHRKTLSSSTLALKTFGTVLVLILFALGSQDSFANTGVTGLKLRAAKGRMLQVVDVLPETPAAMMGIKKGDKIIAIDSVPLTKMTLKQAVAKLKGAPGTRLKLQILRGENAPFDVSLIRAVPQASTSSVSKKPAPETKPTKTSTRSQNQPKTGDSEETLF